MVSQKLQNRLQDFKHFFHVDIGKLGWLFVDIFIILEDLHITYFRCIDYFMSIYLPYLIPTMKQVEFQIIIFLL